MFIMKSTLNNFYHLLTTKLLAHFKTSVTKTSKTNDLHMLFSSKK